MDVEIPWLVSKGRERHVQLLQPPAEDRGQHVAERVGIPRATRTRRRNRTRRSVRRSLQLARPPAEDRRLVRRDPKVLHQPPRRAVRAHPQTLTVSQARKEIRSDHIHVTNGPEKPRTLVEGDPPSRGPDPPLRRPVHDGTATLRTRQTPPRFLGRRQSSALLTIRRIFRCHKCIVLFAGSVHVSRLSGYIWAGGPKQLGSHRSRGRK